MSLPPLKHPMPALSTTHGLFESFRILSQHRPISFHPFAFIFYCLVNVADTQLSLLLSEVYIFRGAMTVADGRESTRWMGHNPKRGKISLAVTRIEYPGSEWLAASMQSHATRKTATSRASQ
jgi:hypothetical protein